MAPIAQRIEQRISNPLMKVRFLLGVLFNCTKLFSILAQNMTYRELTKYLGRLTADQLDSEIVVELGDLFYRVEDGLNIASGEGDYLYKDEVYLSCDTNELCTKEFDKE